METRPDFGVDGAALVATVCRKKKLVAKGLTPHSKRGVVTLLEIVREVVVAPL